MLPKIVMKRSQMVSGPKRRITFREEEEEEEKSKGRIMKSFDRLLSEQHHATEELKVSNIISIVSHLETEGIPFSLSPLGII